MTTKVIMPQMGESIFEGTITKWLKKAGEHVVRDEPLFEISTDKVDSEIPSPATGVLTEIIVPEGKVVQVNTVVAVIGDESTQTVSMPEAPEAALAAEGIESAAGPPAQPGYSPESEGAIAEVPPVSEEMPAGATESKPRPVARTASVVPRDIRTSPLVRRLAREHNLDLSAILGTGLEGRITKQDLLDYLHRRAPESGPAPTQPVAEEVQEAAAEGFEHRTLPTAAAEAPPAESVSAASAPSEVPKFAGDADVVPMTPMRKAIAEHMVVSKRTSAHVNTVFEVDMSGIVQLREKHKAEFESREGIKLTYTPFLMKALVDVVREFPILNSTVLSDSIVYKKAINVGIAVALDSGLIVPVVKDAQLKSLTGLAHAIGDLSARARAKRLKPEEVQDGTITITNPGIYGSLFGTPIIHQPQVAILGVGGIEKRPVVINDAIAIRSMVYLSLTFDHRVIDGAVADQCMASLKNRLQSWIQWVD